MFGFAARKASRHQLHKHVNAHVYLGVLAYYAKQRPKPLLVIHMSMSINRFAWHNGKCNVIDMCIHVFCDVHVFVAYQSIATWLHGHGPGRHLHVRAYSRYTRYALCHDHQLVEIVIGGFAETHLRFGKDYKSAGSHSRYTRGGVYRSPKGAPRYV